MKPASHSPFNGLRRCGWLCGVLVLVLSAPAVPAQTNLALKKAIAGSADCDEALCAILDSDPHANLHTLHEKLTIEDVQMAAEVLRPI